MSSRVQRSNARILIADDDVWMLRTLSAVLARRGYEVETATDGRDAFARAIARPPDLLITDALMPHIDGWTLVKVLRARAEFTDLPVIFVTALSSDEDRLRGFRLGADAYVTKPFRFEEIDLRITTTLRRRRARGARRTTPPSTLRGELEHVGLATVLVLLANERKTGRLALIGYGQERAEILVRDGAVVRASLHGHAELDDTACVRHALSWRTGQFQFVASVVEGRDRVRTSTTHLLLEGAGAFDEPDEATPCLDDGDELF